MLCALDLAVSILTERSWPSGSTAEREPGPPQTDDGVSRTRGSLDNTLRLR